MAESASGSVNSFSLDRICPIDGKTFQAGRGYYYAHPEHPMDMGYRQQSIEVCSPGCLAHLVTDEYADLRERVGASKGEEGRGARKRRAR